MTIPRQILHLVVRDLHLLKWTLLAFVAATAFASVTAVSTGASSTVAAFLCVWMGCAAVAIALQADSPVRSESFWMSRPIAPGTLLVAKLVVAVMVMALPLAFMLGTMQVLALSWAERMHVVREAAVAYGLWLLISMAFAAVTRDVWSLLAVSVFAIIGTLVAIQMRVGAVNPSHAPNDAAALMFSLLLFVVPVAVLLTTFLWRDTLLVGRAIAGAGVLTLWAVAPYAVSTMPPPDEPLMLSKAEQPQLTMRTMDANLGGQAGVSTLWDVAPWRNAERLVIQVERVNVHAKDGTTFTRYGERSWQNVTLRDLPYQDVTAFTPKRQWQYAVTFSAGERARLASGIARIDLVATVSAYSSQAQADLPFVSGATIAANGTVIRVDSVVRETSAASAIVSEMSIGDDRSGSPRGPYSATDVLPRYLLRDDGTGRTAMMAVRSSGTSGGWFLLPGTTAQRRNSHLELSRSYPRDSAMWIPSGPAHLVRLRWDALGMARIQLSVPINSAPSGSYTQGR